MRRYLGLVLLGVLALGAVESRAAVATGNIGVLTGMWVQATYGNGDVQFVGTTTLGSCQAFWVRASDAAAKNLYALLLAARASQRPVRVYAYDDQIWTGSSTPTCRVEAVDFAD